MMEGRAALCRVGQNLAHLRDVSEDQRAWSMGVALRAAVAEVVRALRAAVAEVVADPALLPRDAFAGEDMPRRCEDCEDSHTTDK